MIIRSGRSSREKTRRFLLNPVLINVEIFLFEVGHEFAVLVEHGERHAHHIHIHFETRALDRRYRFVLLGPVGRAFRLTARAQHRKDVLGVS